MKQLAISAVGLYVWFGYFRDQCSYWLPAVGFAGDNGYGWVQFPVLAFLGLILMVVVLGSSYRVLSWLLD